MHTYFFGGISQYFDKNGVLTKDDNVPFVTTIARVTRNANGEMQETKLAEEMPALLGAGSEFIVNPELPTYDNGVVKFDELSGDSIYLGYIFGGIESTAPNVFFNNAANVSSATNKLFKVYLVKNKTNSVIELKPNKSSLQFQVYPNPVESIVNTQFYLKQKSSVTFKITDNKGKLVDHYHFNDLPAMWHNQVITLPENLKKGVYYITILSDYEEFTMQIMHQ